MTLADANRKYFDTIGASYDDKPWFAKVNQQVTDALRARLDWVGIPFANINPDSKNDKEVRLLDYACGPGLMSRIYGPYVTVTRGVDISPNMVATYNARARAAELPASQINAVVGDLFDKENPNPAAFQGKEYQNFDLATVGFGFHHFEDVVHAARSLKERLRPGGVLVINDFLEGSDLLVDENGNPIKGSEGDHSGHTHHHHHHGHGHEHGHHHSQDQKKNPNQAVIDLLADNPNDDDPTKIVRKEMNASIVVPSFTIDGVKKFFTEAGFVDVDVVLMEEQAYMEFAGKRLWRTILFAKGRRPVEDVVKAEKSEL